jgi:hypothetical protein
MRLLTAISIASLVVSIAAVVFVLGLYAELKSTHPMGHSKIGITMKEKDVPLLDEKTVKGLVTSHVFITDKGVGDLENCAAVHEFNSGAHDAEERFTAEYIGNDIWVVVIASWSHTGYSSPCTFTVHDKRAHVILPQEGKTSD